LNVSIFNAFPASRAASALLFNSLQNGFTPIRDHKKKNIRFVAAGYKIDISAASKPFHRQGVFMC
jgi:hypothetical protein